MNTNGDNLTCDKEIEGFYLSHKEEIREQRCTAFQFAHQKSGARLIYLENEDPNNLFCVCFRTPVFNHTGVAHILEHSVLCGSERYPVKDPFQHMLKGSLYTFLNALTYPDKTMYPVSSQVEKDFYNLMAVYCDAVFYPLLTEDTFRQEGWHFHVENMNDPISIKGIVYNEMKGSYSDFYTYVTHKIMAEILPETTYRFDSGGMPEHITDLDYNQFKAFHSQYYHPSNSYFFLYGNLPIKKSLEFLNKNYLSRFDGISVYSSITKQKLWDTPRRLEITAPASKAEDGLASILVVWLYGEAIDPESFLLGKIIMHYLLATESSPLRRALIDSGLGEDLDETVGMEADVIQNLFTVGVRKAKPENEQAIVQCIFDTLQKEVTQGMNLELLEGSIRQVEFRLREITDSSHFPHSLRLAELVFHSWLYDGDPLIHLRFEQALGSIKKHKEEGSSYFTECISRQFLKNPHYISAVITGSQQMGEDLGRKSQMQVEELTVGYSDSFKKECFDQTQKLIIEQKKDMNQEALACIPQLSVSDLSIKNQLIPTEIKCIGTTQMYMHPLFTAGVRYCDIGFSINTLPIGLVSYLPLYLELLIRGGAGKRSREEMATYVNLVTGGLYTSEFCVTPFGSKNDVAFYTFLHGKCLSDRLDDMLGLMSDILVAPRLDNPQFIKEILLEMRNDLFFSITRSGHSYALSYADATLLSSKYIEELQEGILQLRFLDMLLKLQNCETIIEKLYEIHRHIISQNSCFVSLTSEQPDQWVGKAHALVNTLPIRTVQSSEVYHTMLSKDKTIAIPINASINYLAQSWRLDSLTPTVVGNLLVLSRNLSTGYLWNKIRVEGGAYSSSAISTSAYPVFSMMSYRDPNIKRTIEVFTDALHSIRNGIAIEELDQSIIATIGRMDKPLSPHAKALSETIHRICGRTPEIRQEFRDAILSCTGKQLSQRATELLDSQSSVITILGSLEALKGARAENLVFTEHALDSVFEL